MTNFLMFSKFLIFFVFPELALDLQELIYQFIWYNPSSSLLIFW